MRVNLLLELHEFSEIGSEGERNFKYITSFTESYL